MQKLMISVAGIRGTIGGSLRPEEFVRFAAAFSSTLDKRVIVLGGDTRPSRRMLRPLIMGACMATGCRILDLGVVPTPTVGFMTKYLKAGGGIAITASHNPLDWNALKFFTPQGLFLTRPLMDRVLERFENNDFDYRTHDALGSVETVVDPAEPHLKKVLDAVEVDRFREARIRVAVDFCNGAGIGPISQLLHALGCEVVRVFDDPDRAFERVAEPLPENLGALSEAVRRSGAQVGFALDPDADRLALVDETGRPIGEERTLTLTARAMLRKTGDRSPLVANLSTTRALDDVAAEFGTRVERTAIGEANVVERMLQLKSRIGGEGNGGVIVPEIHPGRDAATGIALVLEMLAETGKSLSTLNGEVPDYAMVKAKAGVEGKDIATVLSRLRETFSDAEFDTQDGLKMTWPDAWLHVRPSGTEPIVRVFTEAPTRERAQALAERAMAVVEG
jgi:phosphomannomutase